MGTAAYAVFIFINYPHIISIREVFSIKANTVCKNINCTKGHDGGRKIFAACSYCTKTLKWKSICCSEECFYAYGEQVKEARAKNQEVDLLPDRLDMTKQEVRELIDKPINEVIEITKHELVNYAEDLEVLGVSGVMDKINLSIDKEEIVSNESVKSYTSRKRKKE